MPKKVYSLEDVLILIAKTEKVDISDVSLWNKFETLSIGSGSYGEDVDLDDPLFEIGY